MIDAVIKMLRERQKVYAKNAVDPRYSETQQEIWAALANEKLDDIRCIEKILKKPTHRHIMRGSQYIEIGRGFAQVSRHPIEEMTAVVVYRGINGGSLWVRNAVEFDDGRFEILS